MTTLEIEGFLSEEADHGRQVIIQAYHSALTLAKDLNREAMKVLRTPALDLNDEVKTVIAALMVRITETYQGALLLLERGMISQARMLVRAELEALFSMAAIAKSPKLLDSYVAQHYASVISALKSAKRWKQKSLKGRLPTDRIDELVAYNEAKLKKTQAKRLRVWQWAKEAGLEDFYNVFYVENSSAVHSDMWALDDHVAGDEERGLQVNFGPNDIGLYHALRSAVTALLAAMESFGSVFRLAVEDDVRQFRRRCEELDKEYYSESNINLEI